MLAVPALLPIGRLAELPIAIAAVIIAILLVRRRLSFDDAGVRCAIALFACYWLPALISAISAVEPRHTWSTIAGSVRYLPFAIFVVLGLGEARMWRGVQAAVAAVLLLWLLDAWVQMATGYSIAGPAERERLTGVFGAGNIKLGPVLAVLSPFLLLTARARFGRIGLGIAFVLLLVPILLAGSRAAWLMFAVVGIALAWRETRSFTMQRWKVFLALLGIAALAALLAAVAAWRLSDRFDMRVDRSLLALKGTVSAVDEASAGRLSIWRAAVGMTEAHPLTGVGVRGFRYAYPGYVGPNDRFLERDSDTGASHAHQIVLEVLSETGVIGLALWLIGLFIAARAWWRADAIARERALAPALALLAMTFPINTHLAFYSAWWGLLFWWLLSLYVAALFARSAALAANVDSAVVAAARAA